MSIFPRCTPYSASMEQHILKCLEGIAGRELYRPRLQEVSRYLSDYLPLLPKTRVVIAGTNGKGQVATELAYYLGRQNISHSLFTSPHVLSLTERFSYNGENISYAQLEQLLQEVLSRFGQQFPQHPVSFYELAVFDVCPPAPPSPGRSDD